MNSQTASTPFSGQESDNQPQQPDDLLARIRTATNSKAGPLLSEQELVTFIEKLTPRARVALDKLITALEEDQPKEGISELPIELRMALRVAGSLAYENFLALDMGSQSWTALYPACVDTISDTLESIIYSRSFFSDLEEYWLKQGRR